MRIKKMVSAALACFTIISLCTSGSADGVSSGDDGYEELRENIESLSPTLDRNETFEFGDAEVDNELSKEDIDEIGRYVNVEDGHISLNEEVYGVMPVNDLGVSPEEYGEAVGYEYQYDTLDDYYINYKKLTYVSDNMDLMNGFVDEGMGVIDKDGNLEIVENDYVQQSYMVNYKLRWFKLTFKGDFRLTAFFGLVGILVNWKQIKNIEKMLTITGDEVQSCFEEFIQGFVTD